MGKQKSHLLDLQIDDYVICDRGRIRTLNPRSRNPIFYPVELHGHFEGHKYTIQ